MYYKELAKNYSLEEIVALNRLLDYILEQDYRMTREFLEITRAEGELLEDAKFEEMINNITPYKGSLVHQTRSKV